MFRKTLFIALLLALMLAACAPASAVNTSAGITITDGLGREVQT